ncbi:MAG: caspase family protein [Gemmobacter sp.]
MAVLTTFFMGAGLTAAEARKLALVVGNSDYANVPQLKNASRDATDIAAALERLGFDVTLLVDVKSADFWERVDAFGVEAESAEASVFFYAGHAFQMQGSNYLVPVDATLNSREALRTETWNLDGIIARLQDRRRQTLIFLDACRNDPVPPSVRGSAAADGLARVQTGVGTFVAFATEPGAVTYDGAGDAPNSPFTTALLKQIETPGLSISDMMIKVRNDVAETTGGRQSPWDQSSLREQFYFQAATETKQELTEADYELLAQLSPEDRAQFLELLAASGFSTESLQAADDAITVASYNLEVAAESEITLGAAPAGGVAAPVETVPEFDVSQLEVDDSGQTLGSTELAEGGTTAVAEAPVEPVAEPAPTEVATAPEAPVEPVAEPAPTEVATAPEAPVEPVAEPAPVEVATAPEAPVEPVAEPAPETIEVASAPDAPVEPLPPFEPAGEPVTAEVATAPEAPAEPAVTEVATAPEAPTPPGGSAAPVSSETVASIPATTVLAELPKPDPSDPLGGDSAKDPEPIRLAALTWETRGILELNAVDTDRARVTGNELTADNDAHRELLASIDPALLSDQILTVDEGDLARTIQAELARLGCYRMKVDGSWGKGSRTALTSYFLSKKQVPTSLEPTADLVWQLQRESQVVCAVQVARARVVPGKTKAILPQKAAATSTGTKTKFKPKAGRTAKTQQETKKSISKSLMGAGNF